MPDEWIEVTDPAIVHRAAHIASQHVALPYALACFWFGDNRRPGDGDYLWMLLHRGRVIRELGRVVSLPQAAALVREIEGVSQ